MRDAFTDAVEKVEPQEDEHLSWASDMRTRMVSVQATSRTMQVVGETAEKVVARIRSWLD
jgi:uncharacterized protein with HEPN domain